MTIRRQILLLLLIHLCLALALWDGYRIGYKRGLAVRLEPQTSIVVDPTPPGEAQQDDLPGRESWDAAWRLN